MPVTIEVDFQQGLAVPEVKRADDGRLHLALRRDEERVIVHLSLASLEALRYELGVALACLRSS